jgi:hypothetical protein
MWRISSSRISAYIDLRHDTDDSEVEEALIASRSEDPDLLQQWQSSSCSSSSSGTVTGTHAHMMLSKNKEALITGRCTDAPQTRGLQNQTAGSFLTATLTMVHQQYLTMTFMCRHLEKNIMECC